MLINNDLYAQIIQHTVISTVDLLLINANNQILLWMRNNKPLQWAYYMPGGRIIKWETMIQAAYRKAKQEIGLDIDVSKLEFVWVYDDMFEDSEFDSSCHCMPVTFAYRLSSTEESAMSLDAQHESMIFTEYDDRSLHPFLCHRLNLINSQYAVFDDNDGWLT